MQRALRTVPRLPAQHHPDDIDANIIAHRIMTTTQQQGSMTTRLWQSRRSLRNQCQMSPDESDPTPDARFGLQASLDLVFAEVLSNSPPAWNDEACTHASMCTMG